MSISSRHFNFRISSTFLTMGRCTIYYDGNIHMGTPCMRTNHLHYLLPNIFLLLKTEYNATIVRPELNI
jgi:hypothetical protein